MWFTEQTGSTLLERLSLLGGAPDEEKQQDEENQLEEPAEAEAQDQVCEEEAQCDGANPEDQAQEEPGAGADAKRFQDKKDGWEQELLGTCHECIDEAVLHDVPWDSVASNAALHFGGLMVLGGVLWAEHQTFDFSWEGLGLFVIPFLFVLVLGGLVISYQKGLRFCSGRSELWDLLKGRKSVPLTRQYHLFLLSKAMDKKTLRIGSVACDADPADPGGAERVLTINFEEIPPDVYDLEELTWGDRKIRSPDLGGEIQSLLQVSKPDGSCEAIFKRRQWGMDLWRSGDIRVAVCTVLVFWLVVPMTTFLLRSEHLRQTLCQGAAQQHGVEQIVTHGFAVCSTGLECAEMCMSGLKFASGLQSSMRITHVELYFNLALAFVLIFINSVGMARTDRLTLQDAYLRGLPLTPHERKQVLGFKETLERACDHWELFKLWSSRVSQRFWQRSMLQKELRSDSVYLAHPLDYSANRAKCNQILNKIISPVEAAREASDVVMDMICFEEDWACTWNGLVERHNLKERDFNMAYDIPVCCDTTWKQMLDFLQRARSDNHDVDDVHAKEAEVIGYHFIPRGFALTHVYRPCSRFEEGTELQYINFGDLKPLLRWSEDKDSSRESVDADSFKKAVMDELKTKASGACPENEEKLDWVWFRFQMSDCVKQETCCCGARRSRNLGLCKKVARALCRPDKEVLQDKLSVPRTWKPWDSEGKTIWNVWEVMKCSYITKPGGEENDLTEQAQEVFSRSPGYYLDCDELRGEIEKDMGNNTKGVDVDQVEVTLECVLDDWCCFTLTLSDSNTLSDGSTKVARLTYDILWSALSVLVVVAFCGIAPMRRIAIAGVALHSPFPSPFCVPLVISFLSQICALVIFMERFYTVRRRLDLINRLLREFEQGTLGPNGRQKKGADRPKKGADRQKKTGAAAFDLYLQDRLPDSYDKKSWEGEEVWNEKWARISNNVQSWQRVAGYMRVFTSTSRLTAQAILAATSVILLLLLFMSMLQAWRGQGMLQLDTGALRHQMHQDLEQHLQSGVEDGAAGLKHLTAHLGAAAASASLRAASGARRLLEEEVQEDPPLGQVFASLREHLEPVAGGLLYSPLRRQMSALLEGRRRLSVQAEDYIKHVSLGSVRDITATQVSTVFMILLMAACAGPMILSIAKINDSFARHAGLLISQKSKHRERQDEREIACGKARRDRPMLAEGQEEARLPDPVRAGCDRYEKVLDIAIESAKENSIRFPITLFGRTITTAVLGAWLLLVAGPLLSQLKGMAGPLAMHGCESFVGMSMDQTTVFDRVNNGAAAGLQIISDQLDEKSDVSFDVKALIKDVVCEPLRDAVDKRVDEAMSALGVNDETAEGDRRRRLDLMAESLQLQGPAPEELAMPADGKRRRLHADAAASLSPAEAIDRWWDACPAAPATKLAVLSVELEGLRKQARRLLREVPTAVLEAHQMHGAAAAFDLALLHHTAESAGEEQ